MVSDLPSDLRDAGLSTPAVVLKCDPNPLRHGTLGIPRSLGRLGVPVYGVHEGPWRPVDLPRQVAGLGLVLQEYIPAAPGQDYVARAAYLGLTGQPLAAGEVPPGRRFLVENHDPLGAMGYWRAGELGLAGYAAPVRGADETARFARDDVLPFGLMCLRMGWRPASRRWTRGPSVLPRAAGGPRYRPGRAALRPGRPGIARQGAGQPGAGRQQATACSVEVGENR